MSSDAPAPRLAAWYTLALGAAAAGPWYVLILTRRGWSESAATTLAAVLPAGRMVFGPLWGVAADRYGTRVVLRVVGVASAVAAVGLVGTRDPVATVAWLALASVVRTPAYPIVDALAVERLGARYGAARAWGSASFLALGTAHGLLDDAWPEVALWTSAVVGTLAVPVAEALPTAPARPRGPAAAWWTEPALVWLVAIATTHGVGLAVYDHLFALHVEALGLPGWAQSLALASGVAAEIAVFRTAPRWFPRASGWTWLLVSVAAGVPRFLISARLTDPVALGLVQAAHGLHFGLFWLAATALFAAHARPEWKNTVQALLPTAMFGLGPIVALVGAGALLRQRHETPALLVAAAGVSVVATALAAAARAWVTRRERR